MEAGTRGGGVIWRRVYMEVGSRGGGVIWRRGHVEAGLYGGGVMLVVQVVEGRRDTRRLCSYFPDSFQRI